MNNIQKLQKYKELKKIISKKRKELKIRIERLQYNIIIRVSKNSINAQKEEISNLESIIDSLEYTYQHDLLTINEKMNKEEFIIDEKIYENYEGSKIKIVFSNLGRR